MIHISDIKQVNSGKTGTRMTQNTYSSLDEIWPDYKGTQQVEQD